MNNGHPVSASFKNIDSISPWWNQCKQCYATVTCDSLPTQTYTITLYTWWPNNCIVYDCLDGNGCGNYIYIYAWFKIVVRRVTLRQFTINLIVFAFINASFVVESDDNITWYKIGRVRLSPVAPNFSQNFLFQPFSNPFLKRKHTRI